MERRNKRKVGRRPARFPAVWGWSLLALLVFSVVWTETTSAFFQSWFFSRWGRELTFDVRQGPSRTIHFPVGGPSDKRLGYAQLPSDIDSLRAQGFSITQQAGWSTQLERFAADYGYPIYHEKERVGLNIRDRSGTVLYAARFPEHVYDSFEEVPALVINTLRFIEDRSLLNPATPRRNPAVDWPRLSLATISQVAGRVAPRVRQSGGSTLATQIEKFRHYADGRTRSIRDKYNQMFAAASRSYLDGPYTAGAERRIISTYLNSTPLGSRSGYGEIIGLGDGLWAWFGTSLGEANRLLADTDPISSERKAEIYRQILSLLLAQRRPSFYLVEDRQALKKLTDTYLGYLTDANVINNKLRDAALRTNIQFVPEAPSPPTISFVARKAADAVRKELLRLLSRASLYDLDRLDVIAETTFDHAAQQDVSGVLGGLRDPAISRSQGLLGPTFLRDEDSPAEVNYSVVVYERGSDRNFVRVHTDSLNQPFDVNSGVKLILGSTAKLRTLTTYLDIISRLHAKYEPMPARELQAESTRATDPLSRWAMSHLAQVNNRSLQTMLDAAMQRRYSASPNERFFTGGGVHIFSNYARSDNTKNPTVEEALVHSINLAFIRIMRDIRDYYMAGTERGNDRDAGWRESHLRRFVDQEGRLYLNKFYDEFADQGPDEILSRVDSDAKASPRRLAMIFRSVRPEASVAELQKFLAESLSGTQVKDIDRFYKEAGPDRYALADRAYLARVHPLRLWLATYLQNHRSTRDDMLKAGEGARREAYGWLFRTRSERKQNVRIRIMREQDAFQNILEDWRKQGYPFTYLVPSLATALGSSGDRPDALAQLMGIILNNGIQLPTIEIESVHFAAATPYETRMTLSAPAPKQILAPEVAATLRRALTNVVADGTGMRFRAAYVSPDGRPLLVGGKTGTGDNRIKSYGAGGRLIENRVVDRTATFVFFIGDRFYGTVTAFATGAHAGKYRFTSALAVQLLKSIAPKLQPLIDQAPPPSITVREGIIADINPITLTASYDTVGTDTTRQ